MNESEIFHAAIKLTPELRQNFLDAACAGNQALKEGVQALLRESDEMDSFIEKPAVKDLPTDLFRPITESPGTTIGSYRLMEQIGEGGFGLVFVAEQQQPVRRKVALKIIKPGMDTREVIARFEAERQALALMDHPNIARVFDAGTTDSGRPYFVMELVKGIPITDYCDQQHLTARQRLELFLSVSQAVQHAHTKGIIHRDIKPSNILVAPHDGVPVIKVIDFGVAKAIGQQLTDKTIYTRFTQMIGTPLYMSPEQAEINALDVDTRSDVYSLGVLLYELLTGTTPIDRQRLSQAAYDEIRRIIKEEEPPKPSTRLSTMGETLSQVSNCRNIEPSKLSALVKGDLDWIVMKALEKDRTRRYETATSLAADVRRFLAEEAIEARPPSAWYRFQKVAKRNRFAIATAALVAASLLIGLAGTTWQAYRASQSERVARANEMVALESEKKAIAERDAKEKALEKEAEQRNIALDAQQNAQQERDAAKLAREDLRKSLYAASMNLIPAAWEADNVKRVQELLDAQIPKPGEEDLRHFEWYYWYRQSHGGARSWSLGDAPDNYGLSEDGSRIVGWTITDTRLSRDNPTRDGVVEATIRVLDIATERELHSLRFRAEELFPEQSIQETSRMGISRLSYARDASRIAVVFSLSDGTERDFRGGPPPDTRFPRSMNFKTVVIEAQSQKVLFSRETNSRRVTISPDGKRLFTCEVVSATADRLQDFPLGNFMIWDLDHANREPVKLSANNQSEHAIPQIDATFSPDGSRVLVINREPKSGPLSSVSLRFWDTTTGEEQLNHPLGSSLTSGSSAFRSDGKVLAIAGFSNRKGGAPMGMMERDAFVYLWDCSNSKEIQALQSDNGISLGTQVLPRQLGVTFTPDGNRLIVWNEDENTCSVISTDSGAVSQKLKTVSMIRNVSCTGDGNQIAMLTGDNSSPSRGGKLTNAVVEVWDLDATTKPKALPSPRVVDGFRFSWSPKKLRQIAFQSGLGFGRVQTQSGTEIDCSVLISDTEGNEILRFKEHTGPVSGLIFSQDEKYIISSSYNGKNEIEMFLWETDTGKVRWSFKSQQTGFASALSLPAEFSPDGKWLTLPTDSGQRIVDAVSLKENFHVETKTQLYFSPDSQKLVGFQPSTTGNAISVQGHLPDFDMMIWQVQSGALLATHKLSYPEGKVSPSGNWSTYRVVFSPDSQRCIPLGSFSLGLPDCVDVFNLSNVSDVLRINVSKESSASENVRLGSSRDVVFGPKGDRLLVIDKGSQFRPGKNQAAGVWDLSSGKLLYGLDGNGSAIQAGTFSPDGKRIATASTRVDRGEVKVWDASTGREVLSLTNQRQQRVSVRSLSFGLDRLTLNYTNFSRLIALGDCKRSNGILGSRISQTEVLLRQPLGE